MTAPERLHADDLDALGDRVAERLATFLPALADAAHQAHGTVDVAIVARELGMSETWVYRHADELGVERRGNGPKARLRFDLERARAAFATTSANRGGLRLLGRPGAALAPRRSCCQSAPRSARERADAET